MEIRRVRIHVRARGSGRSAGHSPRQDPPGGREVRTARKILGSSEEDGKVVDGRVGPRMPGLGDFQRRDEVEQ